MSPSSNVRNNWIQEPPPVLRWRFWPIVDIWYSGPIIIVLYAAMLWQIYFATGNQWLVVVIGLLLLLLMAKILLPTSFELNADGIHTWFIGRHRFIPWSQIRAHESDRRGFLLLQAEKRSVLDAVGGTFLPAGRHRDEIALFLHHYVDPILGPGIDETDEDEDDN